MSNIKANALEPKNIIVTGAAQGIGRAIARHLAGLGHHLYLIDRNEAGLSHTVEEHISDAVSTIKDDRKPGIGYRTCDIRNTAAVRETIKAAAAYFSGRVDVLVNNAGIAHPTWTGGRTMEDCSVLDEWAAYIETNLTGAFVTTQAVLPFMKAEETVIGENKRTENATGGGCIINVSSIRALQSSPNCEGYAASKAGLLGLTHAIAISGAQWGIRCNAILPGLIVKREGQYRDEDALNRSHPVGRVGFGEDIARTVEWLIDAGFVTGQEIVVDGGFTVQFKDLPI